MATLKERLQDVAYKLVTSKKLEVPGLKRMEKMTEAIKKVSKILKAEKG